MMRSRLPLVLTFLLLMGVFIAYVLYPLAVMILTSLRVNGELSLERYVQVLDFTRSANVEAVFNSVMVSALSVILGALLGGLFAFTFTQFRFPLSTILARLAVIPLALPPLVGVISFLFVFGESGLVPRILQRAFVLSHVPFYLDGFWAIVAVHVYSFHVYFYLLISDSLRRLDRSLLEAAESMGSSPWNTFRRVLLPQLRPALLGASALTFMTSMASFSAPLIFGGDRRFLTTQIYATKLNGDLEFAAAQSVLLSLVSLAFFFLLSVSDKPLGGGSRVKGTPRRADIAVRPMVKRFTIAASVVMLAMELLPIITIVIISFVREGSWTWQILPTRFTFENYGRLFLDPRILEPISNSVLMTLMTVAASLVFGVTASFIIVKGNLGTIRRPVDLLLTLSFSIPGTVVALSLISAFNSPTFMSGTTVLVGTFWILPLAYFIRTYPLVIRSTSASLEQLDDSLMEAGETFGAGFATRFRRIALPVILPGIMSGCLLVAITALGEFVSSIMLYTYSSRPISVEILSQLREYNFGSAAAYSVFLLVLIFALTLFSGRVGKDTQELGL